MFGHCQFRDARKTAINDATFDVFNAPRIQVCLGGRGSRLHRSWSRQLGDDFSEIERFNITESQRLPQKPLPSNVNTAQVTPGPSNRQRNYCREWNRTGSCNNTSHQPGVEHICAYCKLPDHTIASCPTRPPTSLNRALPPTSY